MRGGAPRWHWACAGASALFALVAVGVAFSWQQIFDYMLASQLALTPTSRSYKEWVAPTVPIFFEVYLFNWTNADTFPEEKPHLEQLGPYRFREVRSHVNITWHPHNDSVAYRTFRSWYFDSETSNGTLQDTITTLNVIAASAAYRYRYQNMVMKTILSMTLAGFSQQMSITKLASELLFDGYQDPLLDVTKNLPEDWTDGAPRIDRFGLFYGRNNSIDTDGYMEVSTGSASGTLPGQILKWNYLDQLPFYTGKCAELSGSAGEFMPHDLTEQSPLTMFVPDLCRTVHMEYAHSGDHRGLAYHKYALSSRAFDYSSSDPSNACFCNGDCLWSGVMNVSACRYNSPAFISLPHFLHADPALRDKVDGMRPDPEKHSFYFAVEPKLGVPLDVAARFQFNVYLEPMDMSPYNNVPNMLFPIFWVQQRVQVEDNVVSELVMVRGIMDWGGNVSAGIALVFMAIFTLVVSSWCTSKPKYHKPNVVSAQIPKDEAELKLNPQ